MGKTINTVYERFYGANGHLNVKTKNSALHEHISETGDPECEFVFEDIDNLEENNHGNILGIYCWPSHNQSIN